MDEPAHADDVVRAALDRADALLLSAIALTRSLHRDGHPPLDSHGGDALGGRCLRCDCAFFVGRSPDVVPGPDAPALGCMRLGCRHLLTSHLL